MCRTYDLSVHDRYRICSKTLLLSLYIGFMPNLWWCPCCSFLTFSELCCVFVLCYLRPVSCVYNVASVTVSGLSILDCLFGFFF
jgi:hypothetical protein